MLNNALNLSYFPVTWKCAKVLPIPKKGKDPNHPMSYRPISLTPNLSKILEIIIGRAIDAFIEKKKLIPDNQFGFRNKISTYDAINKLLMDINNNLSANRIIAACLIDIEKAFDSVWIDGLIYKLILEGFPTFLIDMIYDMITNKTFVVYDGLLISLIIFTILEGLQQGTVNSPRLFNFFTKAVLVRPELKPVNVQEPGLTVNKLAFAGDLIVYVTGKRVKNIQNALEITVNKIYNFYSLWNLRINIEKCETIIFRRKFGKVCMNNRAEIRNFVISIKRNDGAYINVENKKSVKYLGVHLDYMARMNNHVKNQLKKAEKAFNSNKRIFYNKMLEPRAKVICYQLLVRPIITYAAPCWWNIGASLMDKIRLFERVSLRKALKMYRRDNIRLYSNKDLYSEAKIPRKRFQIFFQRIHERKTLFNSCNKLNFLTQPQVHQTIICKDKLRHCLWLQNIL